MQFTCKYNKKPPMCVWGNCKDDDCSTDICAQQPDNEAVNLENLPSQTIFGASSDLDGEISNLSSVKVQDFNDQDESTNESDVFTTLVYPCLYTCILILLLAFFLRGQIQGLFAKNTGKKTQVK